MILAIDTATRWLGLALHDGTAVLAESGWRCLNNHTTELTGGIDRLLRRSEIAAPDLSAIAVAIGPGSYTGLRVGLAVAKGMSLANGTPLIGVSTLDILAAAIGPQPGRLVASVEAGRTRVVTAVYDWKKSTGWNNPATPEICTWTEFLAGQDSEERLIFAGEISPEAIKQIRATSSNYRIARPAVSVRRAGHLAEIGWQRLRKGRINDASLLAPMYLKNPDGS